MRLVGAILSGESSDGTPLREAQLVRQWRVSRIPLRTRIRNSATAFTLALAQQTAKAS